jgi:hypothetical protein
VANASTIENVYVCPTGFRAVVRDTRITNPFAGPSAQTIVGIVPSGGTDSYWLFVGAMTSGELVSILSETVMEAGDALFIYSDRVGTLVYASGAQMPLPS